jgi:hypothetical protein
VELEAHIANANDHNDSATDRTNAFNHGAGIDAERARLRNRLAFLRVDHTPRIACVCAGGLLFCSVKRWCGVVFCEGLCAER